MHEHEYDAMFEMEDTYWWYVGRRGLVRRILEGFARGRAGVKILDVGCGTGANLVEFSRVGESHGIDASELAVEYCREHRHAQAELGEVEKLPYPDATFDVVTALDVLEHTDNDLAALSEIRRVCKPEGLMVFTVPAYGFLWSEHDEALHHRRRYVAHGLRKRATAAGIDVLRSTYFITLLFFPILFLRLWQGLFRTSITPKTAIHVLPAPINRLLIWTLRCEEALTRLINLPFGVSILMIAKPVAAAEEVPAQSHAGQMAARAHATGHD